MQRQDSNDGDATVRMATQRALPAHQAFLGQRQAHDAVQSMTVEDFLLSILDLQLSIHKFLVLSIQGTCKITCKVPEQQSAFSPLSDCTFDCAENDEVPLECKECTTRSSQLPESQNRSQATNLLTQL